MPEQIQSHLARQEPSLLTQQWMRSQSNITIDGTTSPDWTAGPDITLQGDLSRDCLVYGSGGAGLVKRNKIYMDAEKHSNSRWSGWNYFGGTAANENINITGATTGISLEGGNNILYIIKIGNNAGNGKGIDIVDGTTINLVVQWQDKQTLLIKIQQQESWLK